MLSRKHLNEHFKERQQCHADYSREKFAITFAGEFPRGFRDMRCYGKGLSVRNLSVGFNFAFENFAFRCGMKKDTRNDTKLHLITRSTFQAFVVQLFRRMKLKCLLNSSWKHFKC